MLNVEAKSMGLPLVTYRPEGIYTDYTGSFPEALKFNDDCLERFREIVGRMRTFLIIQTLNTSFRGIIARPLPYFKFLLPDPHNKAAVLTISPLAIDMNVQDIQRLHNGGQAFYAKEFKSDLQRAAVTGLRLWGEWEIDHRNNNFIQELLRKNQLNGFLERHQQQLFQPS